MCGKKKKRQKPQQTATEAAATADRDSRVAGFWFKKYKNPQQTAEEAVATAGEGSRVSGFQWTASAAAAAAAAAGFLGCFRSSGISGVYEFQSCRNFWSSGVCSSSATGAAGTTWIAAVDFDTPDTLKEQGESQEEQEERVQWEQAVGGEDESGGRMPRVRQMAASEVQSKKESI
jgi:hypothetical protein